MFGRAIGEEGRPHTKWVLGFAVAGVIAMGGCLGPHNPSGAPVEWETCRGDGYTVSYPPGWFVHPAEEGGAPRGCALFAAQEFAGDPEQDWGWAGAQIVLASGSGCRGSFDQVLSEEQVQRGGHMGWRRELAPGEGNPDARSVEYFLELNDGLPCEASQWFYGRTESDDPGNFASNVQILDQMMESLRFIGDG